MGVKYGPKKEVSKAITGKWTHATLAQVVTPGTVSQSTPLLSFCRHHSHDPDPGNGPISYNAHLISGVL